MDVKTFNEFFNELANEQKRNTDNVEVPSSSLGNRKRKKPKLDLGNCYFESYVIQV